MNSTKLALFNLKNNLRLYRFNLISMSFSIAVFFNFLSLLFNPGFSLTQSDTLLIQATISMSILLLLFISGFIILFANSFFIKQRKREIGIYLLLGIDNRKIAMVYSIETLLMGGISIFLGLFGGLIFHKAFLMLLSKIGSLITPITFSFSVEAVFLTVLFYSIIYFLVCLRGYISISRSRVIQLLTAEKQPGKIQGARTMTGLASIVLILAGLYSSTRLFTEAFLLYSILTMGCLTLGTFLFYRTFLSAAVTLLRRWKRFLYSGTNLIGFSNVTYHIQSNYQILACLTLIMAGTITAISSAISIQYIFNNTLNLIYPYSFTFVEDDPGVTGSVLSLIQNSPNQSTLVVETPYLLFNAQMNVGGEKYYPVIKETDFERLIDKLNPPDKDDLIHEGRLLKSGSALFVRSSNDPGFRNNQLLNMYGLHIKVDKTINTPLLGARFSNNPIVLTDSDYGRFNLFCSRLQTPESEHIFHGIKVENQEDSADLLIQLLKIPGMKNNLNAYITYVYTYTEVTGVVKFTGIFMGLVLIISTASIMFLKLLSDAISDRRHYDLLMKLGLDQHEMYRAVSSQVGLSYILPFIIATLYGGLAIKSIHDFLNIYMTINLLPPFLIGVAIFGVIFILFYFWTTRIFYSLVKS